MTTQWNGGFLKVAVGIIGALVVGVSLFIFQSQWTALSALEMSLASHKEDAASRYVPRAEFIEAMNRLEDTIKEAIRDAKGSRR